MEFIEKIFGIMKPSEEKAQPEIEAKKENDEPPQEQKTMVENKQETDATNDADSSEKAKLPEEKNYTQEEINAIIEEKQKEWEAKQMDLLSKDEQIERLKSELLKRDLKEKVTARLEEVDLPLSVSEFVKYTNETETMENLEKVISTVNQLVQAGIMMRLKGSTPEGLGNSGNNTLTTVNPFEKAFMEAMKD